MGKNKSNVMTDIKNLIAQMTAEFTTDQQITDYITKRRTLNLLVIQAAIGCELKTNKKGKVVGKLHKHKPDNSTLCELQTLLSTFEIGVEQNLVTGGTSDPDDMGIPAVDVVNLAKKDKLKKIYQHLCGSEYGLVNRNIGAADVLTLAAVGDVIRKKTRTRDMFIIGGIILGTTVVVGTTAFILIHNHNKKKARLLASDDSIDLDTDIDLDGDVDLHDEFVDLHDDVVNLH